MDTNTKKRNITSKVFIDFSILSIFTAFLALFYDYLTPYQRGFFCDDEEIMYPHKDNTITNAILWSIGVLVPLSLMTLVETMKYWIGFSISKESDRELLFCGWKVPYVLQQLYSLGGIFLFGIITTEIVSNFFKVLVGRLRPSFLELCKPDFNCSTQANPHYFVEKFTCTNSELKDQNDPRLSFPSGHTAVSTYAMLYATLYLQQRMNFDASFLLKPIMQLLLLFLAGYISFSRLQDNQHHWNDILGGFILGFVICIVMVFTQTDLFKAERLLLSENHAAKQQGTNIP